MYMLTLQEMMMNLRQDIDHRLTVRQNDTDHLIEKYDLYFHA